MFRVLTEVCFFKENHILFRLMSFNLLYLQVFKGCNTCINSYLWNVPARLTSERIDFYHAIMDTSDLGGGFNKKVHLGPYMQD